MENCCESIVKYFLFIINFVFAVTGLLLIGFGVYVYTQANSHPELEGQGLLEDTSSIPIFLITIGIFIFFVSFFGCCGSVLENRCMLLTYAVLLSVILFTEVFVVISGYVRLPEIIQDMKSKMINDYNNTKNVTDFWDGLQQNYTCCGVVSYKDWQKDHSPLNPIASTFLPTFNSTDFYFSPSNLTDPEDIPWSCCTLDPAALCTEDKAYKVGCFEQVEGVLTVGENAAVGIWLFQLLVVICSCWIGLRSKKEENGELLLPRNMRN